MVKVIMHGCNGKMGQSISGLIAEDPEVELVAGVDARDDGHNPYPVFSKIADCNIEADCIIDFSAAPAVDALLDYCAEKKVPCVLCTTGLSQAQLDKISEVSKQVAILKSANMSLGVNLLFQLVKSAANVLANSGFDMEIVEKHHNLKVDAPSGTALALADAINEEMGNAYTYVYDRSQRREKRPEKEIGIVSVRGGTIVGDHDVIYAGPDEVVMLSHRAYSKAVFGKGAVSAAKFLAGKGAGMYDMSDVIADILG